RDTRAPSPQSRVHRSQRPLVTARSRRSKRTCRNLPVEPLSKVQLGSIYPIREATHMRRFAILLVPAVATLRAVVGNVMSWATAHGDVLAQVTVTVEKPPVNSLLTLCLSSQSLHPTPSCATIP